MSNSRVELLQLSKLFESINVHLDQTLEYSNTSSQSASFDRRQSIEDGGDQKLVEDY